MIKIHSIRILRLCTVICFMTAFSVFGQQLVDKSSSRIQKKSNQGIIRCATTENEAKLQAKNPNRLTKSQFENWLAPIIETQKQNNVANKTAITIYTIPVVIHIIHNGDAINTSNSHTSENISDAQAASQITVLNQDYRKIAGTPGFGNTGYKLGVDCLINFVLAKQDPYGVLTTGIEHINLGKEDWSEEEVDAFVKPEAQWDPKKYLNIWTVKFSVNLLGYAQFPSNSNLGGLNTSGGDANTDGVVISYNAMGTSAVNDGSFELNANYGMGRTATHEIGHFLGLRHIWGDDDVCSGSNNTTGDYVTDTPDSDTENYVCAVPTPANCIGNDMIENYMDYTNDACLNTFTLGQKARMVAVMTNSIRRKELATSTVATPGFVRTLDAALGTIFYKFSGCNSSFTPSINIENKGTTTLQTANITYSINNSNPQTFIWNGNLAQNTSGLISLPEIPLSSGTNSFSVTINTINNSTDLNNLNNTTSKNITIPSITQLIGDTTPKVTLTLQCDRDGSETTWTIKNSAGITLYNGGPYEDATSSTQLNPAITAVFNLQNGECYTFTINDSYGDGINTNGGLGSYSLKDENDIQFASGSTFLFSETKPFTYGNLSTITFDNSNEIYLYPNPTKDFLNISIPSYIGIPNRYCITNGLGQKIISKQIFKESDLSINISSLSQGIYYIAIEKGDDKKTIQFIKE